MPDFDTRQPQEPDEPNGLRSRSLTHGLRNLLTAHGLRTLLISGGILLFVVVAVSMLAGRSYYGSVNRSPSPSVETKEPDRGAPTQPCEGIDPDGIRNGKIAFDLADEAVPVAQDPKGMGIAAPDIWTVNPNGSDPVNLTTNSRDWDFDETPAWSPDGRRLAFAKRNTNFVGEKKRRRDRLIGLAEPRPEWAVGFSDECWWSRVALLTLSSWSEEGKPERLLQRSIPKDDPEPKARSATASICPNSTGRRG